jgi:hypothetical protein
MSKLVAYLLNEKPPFAAGQGLGLLRDELHRAGMIIETVPGKRLYVTQSRVAPRRT